MKNRQKTTTITENVTLLYHIVNVIDDRDGDYVLSHPVMFPILKDAVEYAQENFKRFIKSNWGTDFKKWYPIRDTLSKISKELAENGQFVMADDSGNFRRVYQLDEIEVPLVIGQVIGQ